MPPEPSARSPRVHSLRRSGTWYRRFRLPRAVWPYALVAAALLAASEALWLWHSWPVRQVLEDERPGTGASI